MKRFILSLSGLLVLSLGLDAQLRVLSNGHIQAGDWTANIFSSNPECGLGVIYVSGDNYLPQTFLISNGNQISNLNVAYSFRNLYLGILGYGNKICLRIGSNSNIKFKSYNLIKSDGGIVVDEQGSLVLISDHLVNLKNDKVKKKGKLDITSKKVELMGGIEIYKGGVLEIKSN